MTDKAPIPKSEEWLHEPGMEERIAKAAETLANREPSDELPPAFAHLKKQ